MSKKKIMGEKQTIYACVDWAVRTVAPMALHAEGFHERAARLHDRARIRDSRSAWSAQRLANTVAMESRREIGKTTPAIRATYTGGRMAMQAAKFARREIPDWYLDTSGEAAGALNAACQSGVNSFDLMWSAHSLLVRLGHLKRRTKTDLRVRSAVFAMIDEPDELSDDDPLRAAVRRYFQIED